MIIGGNCIVEYEKMLSGIADSDPGLLLDRKNIFTGKGSLDICVRQSIENGIPDSRVDPVYVREFVPFGG